VGRVRSWLSLWLAMTAALIAISGTVIAFWPGPMACVDMLESGIEPLVSEAP
jgi:hypothetical protein